MKKVLVCALFAGLMTTAANGAFLDMKWAGTEDTVMTLAPSETATIEIWWTMSASDGGKSPAHLTDLQGRFWVFDHEPVSPENIAAGFAPSLASVTGVAGANGFNTGSSDAPGAQLEDYFFGYNQGDIIGTNLTPTLVGTVEIHCDGPALDPVYIAFNVIDPLPAANDGPGNWVHRWQYSTFIAPGQFRIGQGNPGDQASEWDPFHNYEVWSPLTLIQTPEPATLALLALGGLAVIRRR